ncbi:TonB-dependent receptor domain-containing protein [Brevundimonas sp.]|uniref:TonB-dependent receptor family protein n=1 Tax=Brevundimonas sp. TaxID=1871086 RepID=UPI00289961AE|nr:TonB-dependent receptor [Brevundimonas sp.]
MSRIFPAAPRALLMAACAVPALLSTPALAETNDTPTAVDSIIVTARRNPEDPAVTAEARARLSRTPGAVAVVSAESHSDRFTQSFADTLRNVAGVTAQRRYGEESRLSIRGSGIGQGFHQRGVLLAQNGVPFADADGFSDFQGVDSQSSRYIEVYKGGNALRFGGAQLGGAVNLVTPTGRTAVHQNLYQLEAGTADTYRVRAEIARAADRWDVYAAATAMQSDGWRDHQNGEQLRGTLNLGYQFGEDREVRLIGQAADIKQKIAGSLTLDQALNTPRRASASAVAGDNARDVSLQRLALQTRWRFDDALLFEGAIWGWQKDLYHPIFQVVDQDSQTWGLYGRFDWNGMVAGKRADAFWGLNWRDGEMDALRFVNLTGRRGTKTAEGLQAASSSDLFAEGRLFVTDELAVVGGATYGRATRDYRDHLNPANNAKTDFDWIAPRIGVLWEDAGGTQVFANITRSVEPPHFGALVQAPYPQFVPVEPQKAWTAEIGTRGRRDNLAWDVALYRAELTGEMLNFTVSPDVPAAIFNAGDTIHQGLEASLEWTAPEPVLGGRLTVRPVWTWSDFRFDGDPVWGDNRLPVIPEHQIRTEATWRGPRGLFIRPSVEWRASKPFVDYANTMKAPAYVVWGLSGGVDVTDHVSLYIEGRNLTDKRYVPEMSAITDARIASSAVFVPADGRSVFVGLRLSY